jgi:hypothetical protein
MSLPNAWIDRIFTKLTLVYGREFTDRWAVEMVPMVKADWAHELAGFKDHPEAIAHGLQHLPPDRAPTVLQFRDICRNAPAPEAPRLEAPVANPEVVRAWIAKAREALTRPMQPKK